MRGLRSHESDKGDSSGFFFFVFSRNKFPNSLSKLVIPLLTLFLFIPFVIHQGQNKQEGPFSYPTAGATVVSCSSDADCAAVPGAICNIDINVCLKGCASPFDSCSNMTTAFSNDNDSSNNYCCVESPTVCAPSDIVIAAGLVCKPQSGDGSCAADNLDACTCPEATGADSPTCDNELASVGTGPGSFVCANGHCRPRSTFSNNLCEISGFCSAALPNV